MNLSRKDKIRGSLIGGAIGDALGYPVEFASYSNIKSMFGENGITRFVLNNNGVAEISDDTQMTLFTANGLLYGITRFCMRGIGSDLFNYVAIAYDEWLQTQMELPLEDEWHTCWIRNISALNSRRAPGNTCLSALTALREQKAVSNNSKGCGGVMRAAPIGLLSGVARGKETIDIACDCAAITHKHPLGYIPAGILACIIRDIVDCSEELTETTFEEIVRNASTALLTDFNGDSYAIELGRTICTAMELAKGDGCDYNNIRIIGEGWTGDEALAIAIYCSLRHWGNFEDAIVAAVNHDGDSDSTGAICGNIMGAACGLVSIPQYYKDKLELADVIIAIADDLCTGCIVSEYGDNDSLEQLQWMARYINAYPYGFPYLTMKKVQTHYEIPDLCCDKPEEYILDSNAMLKANIPAFFYFNSPECSSEQEAMLSIWWPCKVRIEGTVYNSVGQYMQAEKARVFGDLSTRNRILTTTDKYEILELGNSVCGYDERKWRSIGYVVAVCGNYHKFIDNEKCKNALLSTKDLILVKDSDYDSYWGAGCSRNNPQIENPENWKGKNLLGFALMQVREILNNMHWSRYSYGGKYIFKQEDQDYMDSLPTIKEKLAFKNKLITDGKYTSDMYIWTQSGKFVCKFGTLICFEPSPDNIVLKENGMLVLKHLIIPADEKDVRYIADGLFNNIEVKEKLSLPWSLVGIGQKLGVGILSGVFNRCVLPKVCIPENVELLGGYVFGNSRIGTLKIYRKSLRSEYGRQFKGAKIENLYIPDCTIDTIERSNDVLHSIFTNASVEYMYLDNYVKLKL